jgi:RalA-binding protein 1
MADDFEEDSFSDSDEILEGSSGYDGKYEYELGPNGSDNDEGEIGTSQEGPFSISLESGDKAQQSPKQRKLKKINFGWKKRGGKKKKADLSALPLNPVFGVPLSLAVQRSVIVDGIELPTVFRECIDFLEERGLAEEGVYRLPGVKSQVEALKNLYDRGETVDLSSCEVHTVASLLKLFLRQFPEPLFPPLLNPLFDRAAGIQNEEEQVAALSEVISKLPAHNRLLLGWLMVHITHIAENSSVNLMSVPNMIVVFQPTLQTSYPALYALTNNTEKLFRDIQLVKYEAPDVLESQSGEFSNSVGDLSEYDTEADLRTGIERLEREHAVVLNVLQEKFDPVADNQAWEIQRLITEFRRKLKGLKRAKQRENIPDSHAPHRQKAPRDEVDDSSDPSGVESSTHIPSVDEIEATMAAELNQILSKTEQSLRRERNALLVIRETLKDEIEKERNLIAQYKDQLKTKPDRESDHEESVCFFCGTKNKNYTVDVKEFCSGMVQPV